MTTVRFARGIGVATLVTFGLIAWSAGAQEATSDKVVAALPKIEAYAEKLIADDAVPSLAVAVVFNDEVVYLKGFGVREVGKAESVDADTVFQIASFSKPMSSTVVAVIVSDGEVTWDSRIADNRPHVPVARRLSHRFDTGATIIREGDPGDSMFVIADGTVAISFNHGEGRRHVATLRAGDTVGEMSLMSGAPRAATVLAETSVVAFEIDRSAVQPLLAANPALFDRFAEMLQKRRAALDELYGPGVWPFAAPRDDDLAVIIRTYFSDIPRHGAS